MSLAEMKFIIDVDVGYKVEEYLSENNINILTIRSINPKMTDREILQLAVKENRIVITMAKDFGGLIFNSNFDHSGVLLLRLEDAASIEKIKIIDDILNNHFNKLENNFSVYKNRKLRIHPKLKLQ